VRKIEMLWSGLDTNAYMTITKQQNKKYSNHM
jgi:hypothetical protein